MKILLHPIFLFFIGTLIGLSPYIFGSSYFDVYHTFQLNNEIQIDYLLEYEWWNHDIESLKDNYLQYHNINHIMSEV